MTIVAIVTRTQEGCSLKVSAEDVFCAQVNDPMALLADEFCAVLLDVSVVVDVFVQAPTELLCWFDGLLLFSLPLRFWSFGSTMPWSDHSEEHRRPYSIFLFCWACIPPLCTLFPTPEMDNLRANICHRTNVVLVVSAILRMKFFLKNLEPAVFQWPRHMILCGLCESDRPFI